MVYFVGAGPGDVDLLTVKGLRLLEKADCVIYAGSLINHKLLDHCKEGARLVDSAYLSLDEIIDICRQTEPGITVRLQTGDTALYSAINEQTDLLDKENISYETVPGVSSFLAAAAALNTEYTVPGKSQSLIISRIEGRTPVPESEDLTSLAAHGTSMVLFLSAGHTREVSNKLIEGGYSPDTPACIIYHASWPDEKVLPCTVGTLAGCAKENGISKTALLIIGDFLKGSSQKSLLYDSHFTTGYRRGADERREIACCAFSQNGYELGKALYPGDVTRISRRENSISLDEWTRENFNSAKALIFIGAVQIAVRAVAPYIQTKLTDPAVIVIDEDACHVIPVLSGHVGGGIRLSYEIRERLRALGYDSEAVITTASDRRGLFAADSFAADKGMKIYNPEEIVRIQSDILKGKKIRAGSPVNVSFPVSDTEIICEKEYKKGQDLQIRVAGGENLSGLILIPKAAVMGIGLKRGTSADIIRKAYNDFILTNHIYSYAIRNIATIDIKKDEEGLLDFARDEGLDIDYYPAKELACLDGEYSDSAFVEKITGVGNVCERAAALSAGRHYYDEDKDSTLRDTCALSSSRRMQGHILISKTVYEGVTLALAVADRL